jgi:hypothetical protein
MHPDGGFEIQNSRFASVVGPAGRCAETGRDPLLNAAKMNDELRSTCTYTSVAPINQSIFHYRVLVTQNSWSMQSTTYMQARHELELQNHPGGPCGLFITWLQQKGTSIFHLSPTRFNIERFCVFFSSAVPEVPSYAVIGR